MAEGFGKFYGNGRVEVKSAGTSAAGTVNGSTVEAMKEIGMDISFQTSKQLTEEMIEWADVVVTLAGIPADALCPASYRGRKHDWKIDDPLGRPWEIMRRVRDDIESKVRELIDAD
jgi:arsenate reductase